MRELNGEDEIFQMPDETESLALPLQRRQEIHKMPEGNHVSREMPLGGRHEIMGDEHAQELECPIQENGEPVRVKCDQELESPRQTRCSGSCHSV